MSGAKVAFLVYDGPFGLRDSAKRSFDAEINAGAMMVKDCLNRAGIEVDYCSPDTAKDFKVVLVSLTSVLSVYDFIYSVGKIKSWKNRSFTSVIGGFGCQNIYPFRHYVDYAVFGRCESYIAGMIQSIIEGKDYQRETVMHLSAGVTPVKIGQTDTLYPYTLPIDKFSTEAALGCPRKCYFCHYTFARKFIGKGNYVQSGSQDSYRELTFDQLANQENKNGVLSSALDGFSERLRLAFNKRISNELIIETTNRLSQEWLSDNVGVDLYLIGSHPTETTADREELTEVLSRCTPKIKPIIYNFRLIPFIPSAATPAAYLPASFDTDWSKWAGRRLVTTDKLKANFSPVIQSEFLHIMNVVSTRATSESDDLINTVVFSKNLAKLKAGQKVEALRKAFDLTPYTREYLTSERLPTWYLEGYIPNHKIAMIARKLKKNLGMGEKDDAGTEDSADELNS